MGVRLVSLEEALREADFITVHLPKSKETIGLIGDRELHAVKPNVRLINVARGGIIDENALYSAIKEGRVAGAASTCSRRSRSPTARSSSSTRWSSPRTWAPPPTRPRRRPHPGGA